MSFFRTLIRKADRIPARRATIHNATHPVRPTVGSSTAVNTSKPSSSTQINFDNPSTIGNTWRKKILPQLMPAVAAPVLAPTVYNELQKGQENTYR